MSKLIAARGAQFVMESEFVFNFDDTMVSKVALVDGAELDFGKVNTVSTAFDIINLPAGAVILAGSVTTETAFDAATYNVSIGDSGSATRYLGATDKKGTGVTALVPTGYRGDGENLRLTVVAADVCTTGKATVRIQYITTGRSNEVNPN